MATLDYILKTKPNRRVLATFPSATVLHAVDEMCSARVGAILIVDDGRPVGILSERDLLTRVLLKRRDPRITRVAEVMTRDVVAVHRDVAPEAALGLMTQLGFRHLPVVDDVYVIGMVSIGDLAHWSAGNQMAKVTPLDAYVMEPGRAHIADSTSRIKGAAPASQSFMRAVNPPKDVKRRS